MSETHNRFENVGVANTGDISRSTVTGNSQQINNESAQALLEAFATFKLAVQADTSLTIEQKEDALSAASQIEAEVKKPESFWSMSTVRNGVNALKALASGAQALNTMYTVVHPLLAAHFNLPM